jgi:hypothetical protein
VGRVNACAFGGVGGDVVVSGEFAAGSRWSGFWVRWFEGTGKRGGGGGLGWWRLIWADLRLAVGSYDGTVRLWDAKSQAHKPLMVLSEAKDSISSVCVVEHEIMSGSVDGRVRVYDLRMGMVYIDVIGRECALHHYSSPPPSHSPYAFEEVETGNCSPAVAHMGWSTLTKHQTQ